MSGRRTRSLRSESEYYFHPARQRGFSESSISSILSSQSCDFSLRSGSTFYSASIQSRPLPDVPLLNHPQTRTLSTESLNNQQQDRPLLNQTTENHHQIPSTSQHNLDDHSLPTSTSENHYRNRTLPKLPSEHQYHSLQPDPPHNHTNPHRHAKPKKIKTHPFNVHRRTLIILCVSSFILNIFCLSLLGLIFVKYLLSASDDSDPSAVVCDSRLACSSILWKCLDIASNITMKECENVGDKGNNEDCFSRKYCSSIINLLTPQEHDDIDNSSQPVMFKKVIAHVVLNMPKPDNRVDRLEPTQLSITNSPAGKHFPGKNYLSGVEIQGDFLKVAKSGLYFVYSTTNFKPRPASSDKGTHYKMSQFTIQLVGPEDTPMPLFSSSNSPCEFCSGYFIGGITRLRAGDKIYVTVSGIELEHLDNGSSYLGLVLLTDEAS